MVHPFTVSLASIALTASLAAQPQFSGVELSGETVTAPDHPGSSENGRQSLALQILGPHHHWVLIVTQVFFPTTADEDLVSICPPGRTTAWTEADLLSELSALRNTSNVTITSAKEDPPLGVTLPAEPALFVDPARVAALIDAAIEAPASEAQQLTQAPQYWSLASPSWATTKIRNWSILKRGSTSVPYMSMTGLLEKTLYEQFPEANTAKSFITHPYNYTAAFSEGMYVAMQAIVLHSPSSTPAHPLGTGSDLDITISPVIATRNMESPPPDDGAKVDMNRVSTDVMLAARNSSIVLDITGSTTDMRSSFAAQGVGEPQFGTFYPALHTGYGRVEVQIPGDAPLGPVFIKVVNASQMFTVLNHVIVTNG